MNFKIENFYSKSAWDVDRALLRADEVLGLFNPEEPPKDISHVIELYDLYLLITSQTKHSLYFDGSKYINHKKSLMTCVAKFYSQICDKNIKEYADDCYHEFWDTFWDLIVKFNVYKRVENFPWVAEECGLPLYKMLQYKDLVNSIDDNLSTYMRESNQTARTLIDYFLRKHVVDEKLYIPKGFSGIDAKKVIENYVSGEDVNANILTLIIEAPKNMPDCPIDDRMKIRAENRLRDIFEGKTQNLIVHSKGIDIRVSFSDNVPDTVQASYSADRIELKYDVTWIRENLDYPTLLNNFIYIFGFVDPSMRWQCSEKTSSRGAIEDSFLVKGIKSYVSGHSFRLFNSLSSMQMAGYYNTLSKLGIALEDVIKWFFEEYLKIEFSAEGFVCNMPKSSDSYLAKCKLIVSAMDGVAKQYRMYLEDGSIDRELYERSSEHMRYEELGSFQSCKYAYCKDNRLFYAQKLLFSDQSHLTYTEKTKSKYDSFARMISEEKLHKEDFHNYQWLEIEKLIELDIVRVDGDGNIQLNDLPVALLYELYSQEVICYQYRNNNIIDGWIENGFVETGNTLFSKGESSYINYMLNQSEFSNGKDLRNKYIHDSCTQDEQVQMQDYYTIFKIMVLLVIKINEEFCLRDRETQ